MEAKYLICTEADANHNKYYKMIPDQNGISFTVEYGRIGAKPMKRSYPASRFHVLYNEKLQKGYVDQTALHENVSDAVKGKFKKIEDSSVDWLINTLMAYANKVIDQNYTVKIEEVTPEMVNTASELLDDLSKRGFVISTSEFNRKLLKLFQVIPRKMKNVEDHLAASSLDYEEILEREYDILDVMHSQVASTGKLNLEHTENKNEKTILDVLGLTIRPCTPEENKKICEKLTDESKGKFARAWYISNKKTDDRYNLYCQKHHIGKRDTHFLYHGSKNMNYYGIMTEGLKLNPNAPITGKMFGHGLYFATRAKKSIGYTSLHGAYWTNGCDSTAFLLVYKVAYKKPFDVYTHESRFSEFHEKDIARIGKDALFAHKGKMLINDEVIIYREDQCTLRYIIELH